MKIRLWGYLLVSLTLFALLGGGLWLGAQLERGQPTAVPPPVAVRVVPLAATHAATGIDPSPQVVVGTPEYYTKTTPTRYTYRNEFPADPTNQRQLGGFRRARWVSERELVCHKPSNTCHHYPHA